MLDAFLRRHGAHPDQIRGEEALTALLAKMEEGLAVGDLHAGWIGGSSRIEYLDEEGTLFNLWMAKAIVELDIPWYYSEAEQQLESYETTE